MASYRVATLFGVPVRVHWTFLLLPALWGWMAWAETGRVAEVVLTVAFILAFFVCIVAHEFGHILTARRYGVRTRDVVLLPIGGVARMERIPEKPSHELWITLAGPAVNVAIAAAIYGVLFVAGVAMPDVQLVGGEFLGSLFGANVFVAIFNLVPAFPMDGGRILRSLLAMKLDRPRATRIAARTGQAVAVCFAAGSFYLGNPMLLLIAAFVWYGAGAENEMVQMRARGGPIAGDAVETRFLVFAPEATAGEAARIAGEIDQADWPVVRRGRLLGMVRREAVLEAARTDPARTVERLLDGPGDTVEMAAPLLQAGERLQERGGRALPVVHKGRLVGLLTVDSLMRFVRAAAPAPPPSPARDQGDRLV